MESGSTIWSETRGLEQVSGQPPVEAVISNAPRTNERRLLLFTFQSPLIRAFATFSPPSTTTQDRFITSLACVFQMASAPTGPHLDS